MIALLALCAPATLAQQPMLEQSVIVSGLEQPWGIAFLPAGHMLVTQKCSGLFIVPKDASRPTGYAAQPTALFGVGPGAAVAADDAFCLGQSGFNGVAVDPAFGTQNRYVYVYFPSSRSMPGTNRVARLTLAEDLSSVSGRTDIITDIALKNEGTPNGNAGAHSGGRIRFGPDGFLYVTTGDNHNGTIPQDLQSLGAKVLRVTRSGAAAPGNGTPPGGDPRIYTYGHRNVQVRVPRVIPAVTTCCAGALSRQTDDHVQGIAFRPGTGQAFTAEHGPNHSDEVTPLVAGGNAGWDPKNRPNLDCPDNYCGYAGDIDTMPMTDTQRFPDAMEPAWVWNGANRGTGPAEFLQGAQWGAWDGALALGIMADESMYVLTLDEAGMAVNETKVQGLPPQRYRALKLGPDNDLFVVVDSGEVWRVVANGGAAAVPEAAPQPRCEPGVTGGADGDAPEAAAPAPASSGAAARPAAGATPGAGAAAPPPPQEAAAEPSGATAVWCRGAAVAAAAVAGAALVA